MENKELSFLSCSNKDLAALLQKNILYTYRGDDKVVKKLVAEVIARLKDPLAYKKECK